MSKIRSCRRTAEKNQIHESAVKLRKMTDEKLIDHITTIDRQAYNYGYEEGYAAGKKDSVDLNYEIAAFIEAVAYLPGIGKATVDKMWQVAGERGVHVNR